MSVIVRKKRIYSDTSAGRYGVMLRLLEEILAYGTSISGIKQDTGKIYSSINFSGGDLEEFIFNWNSSYPAKFGACRDGHEDFTDPDTYTEIAQNSEYDIFLYLYEQDGKLIGLNTSHNSESLGGPARDSGHVLFYYDEDAFKVCFQGYYGDYVSPTYGDLRVADGYAAGGNGTTIIPGEYEFAGYFAPNITGSYVAGGNYKTAAGYVLKYPVVQSNVKNEVYIQRDYPVSIACGDFAIYGYRGTRATYKRIRVDGKKYIHIGGGLWIEYDTMYSTSIHI